MPWDRKNFRAVSVLLPPALVVALDDLTPTHRSRSSMVAEAVQAFVAAQGVDVEIPDDLYRPMVSIHERGPLGRILPRPERG